MEKSKALQAALLNEAAADIRKLYQGCLDAGIEPPVIFVVDMNDRYGAAFADLFVPREVIDGGRVQRDGGMRPDAIGTILHPMSFEHADAALSKMNQTGGSLRSAVEQGFIVVVVVAFGAVAAFKLSGSP